MAQKRNPQVVAARQQAIQQARASGKRGAAVQQAGRQAAQQTRQSLRAPMPQPPAPAPGGGAGQGGYYQYTPTPESQINQPYQDYAAAGAYGSLQDVLGRQTQQGQMANIYGQGAAQNLGGAAQAMGPLAGVGGGYTNQAGMTLGQYGALQPQNQGIIGGLGNEIQGIQAGNLDVDPAMVQQMDQQQRLLESQLQRQLGPDWATSSAGIEAMGRFQQGKQTALASANYNRLLGLYGAQQQGLGNLAGTGVNFGQFGAGVQGQQFGQGAQLGSMFGGAATDLYNQAMSLRNQQLGGASQLLGQAGQTQGLYAGIPQTMGAFGQAMSGQAGAAVNAAQPYQSDRYTQLGTQYAPTKGEFTGQTLVNQGHMLNESASSMGGAASQGGGPPQTQY